MARRTQPSSSEIEALKKEIRKPGSLPYVRIGAYGVNGSGKTRFAASSGLPTLLLDFNEEGDRSIKGKNHVRVLPIRSWDMLGNAYWWLKGGRHPFKVVGLDTITGMQDTAMDFVLGEAEDRDPTRERGAATKRDWGRTATLMRGMLLAYRNLPMHVIFLAQERRIRDEDTEQVVEITMDLPAGSRGTAMSSVGVLGRMIPKEVVVKKSGKKTREWRDHLMVAPHEIMRTKDRTNSLGPVLGNPTLTKVIKAWEANPPGDTE